MRLRADNLYYEWPQRDGNVQAVAGFTAVFDSGMPQILCGPSGSGKSTAGLLLAGLIEPVSGSVRLNDDTPSVFSSRAAFVFQFPENIFFEDSVVEELNKIAGANRAGVVRYLTSLGISFENIASLHPFHLSAGYGRMVAIALQMAREPSLLILDEPTIGLDWRFHNRMCKVLKEWSNDARILIVITHDLDLMRALDGNACVLAGGRQSWKGPTQALLNDKQLLDQYGLLP